MNVKLLLWAGALWCVQALAEAPLPSLANSAYERAHRAMYWADWDELERLDAAARVDPERARNGGLALCQVREAIGRGHGNPSLAYHEARVAGTLAWAQRRPELALAHAAHLEALSGLAWFHRGGGYANTVSDQRFRDFRATLDRAQAYAEQHAAVLSGDGFAAQVMAELLRDRGASVAQQLAAARRGLKQEPWDECIYRSVINSLMPKWGGTPQQLDAWVREAMRNLPEAEASMRYVRLYNDAVDRYYEQSLFEDTPVQWPLMREGLKRMVAAHPQSEYWRNRRGFLACMAKDRETAAEVLEAIDKPDLDAWSGGSDGQRNFQACKRWALQS